MKKIGGGVSLSHVWLCATPWTAAHRAPLPMGLSSQEYWGGLPLYCAFKNLLVGQISWDIFLLQHKIKKEINQTIIYKIFRKETIEKHNV